jgi:hypothetical protein
MTNTDIDIKKTIKSDITIKGSASVSGKPANEKNKRRAGPRLKLGSNRRTRRQWKW